ncbi:MAG: fumarylacetoacetate hydrolase family protein [Candidatus Eremiobacteraeota bacterium]|nr:fumarylacetoacetate hydrolase family protein [Candidatus Eremiobacteraeota bacterium]
MKATRGAFLAGVAAGGAVATARPVFAAANPETVKSATKGLTFTTLRDRGVDHLGIRTSKGIVDVGLAAKSMGISNPPMHVDDVIVGAGDIGALARIAANAPASAIRDPNAVEYGPLAANPPKILCIGLNYAAHIEEMHDKIAPDPELFNKYNSSLNRHKGTIKISGMPGEGHFDYETELVAFIGKSGKNIPESQALDHVFGYAIGHDFTDRYEQYKLTQWLPGKAPDQYAPLGPWLVTADQIPDPQKLQIQTFVNDETTPRQNMSTAQMMRPVSRLIAYCSSFVQLVPGDIIYTGTPPGVIYGYPKDKQVWLKPGDRIRSTITNLGELTFTLV